MPSSLYVHTRHVIELAKQGRFDDSFVSLLDDMYRHGCYCYPHPDHLEDDVEVKVEQLEAYIVNLQERLAEGKTAVTGGFDEAFNIADAIEDLNAMLAEADTSDGFVHMTVY